MFTEFYAPFLYLYPGNELDMTPTAVNSTTETKAEDALKKANGSGKLTTGLEHEIQVPAEDVDGDDHDDGEEDAIGEGAAGGQ